MQKSFEKILKGYKAFRQKYAQGYSSIMQELSESGQRPEIMFVSCCDSRVDPALILQCDPGDLFIVRNVASIVPPFEKDQSYHGTSAALEFGIRFLNVKHLIILGHSQCGGMQALLNDDFSSENDFITKWVSIVKKSDNSFQNVEAAVKSSLQQSYENCLTFPWIKEKVENKTLKLHLWFFDIKTGQIFTQINGQNEWGRIPDITA